MDAVPYSLPLPIESYTPTIVCALAVLVLLVAEARDSVRGKWIAKPVASTAFVWTAIAAGALADRFGRVVLLGLVLCWVGDVLLIPEQRPRVFQAGIAAFLLGHLAYTIAFASRGLQLSAASIAGVAMVAGAWAVLRWLGPHVPSDFRVPVRAYVAVIGVMLVTAVGAAVHAAAPGLALAAIAFLVSDLSVARDRFVTRAFVNRAWGLPLYYAAQIVFALAAGSRT